VGYSCWVILTFLSPLPYITSRCPHKRPSFKSYQSKDCLPQEDMPRPYGEPNSGSYQIDYQTLCSSPALAGVENMDILELDIRRLEETPPLQVFQRGRDDWYKQATSQQRYHGSPSEWVACPWRGDICSNDHRDGNAGFCSPSICGSGPTQNIPLDDISSPRSLGRSSHYGTVGSCDTLESYGSSNTSYSQPGATGSDSIDPELMESDR